MKNVKKIISLLMISLIIFILSPNFSNAESTQVGNEDDLVSTIKDAKSGDVISLSANIELTKPIEIVDKNIAINGNGHTISRNANNWTPNDNNATLITAGDKTTLNLVNLKLINSQKYGVQAYNGGYVILDNVTISNCAYGGVLVNAGTVEVKNLILEKNGGKGYNNGIEIAKGQSIAADKKPVLKMNGTLYSTETDQVIYVDINDPVSGFEIINAENSPNKVLLNGNKLVVTDKNNEILYESNEIEDIDFSGETYIENVLVTINVLDKTVEISLQKGSALSKEVAQSRVNLETLGLNNYTLDGFFADSQYTTEFNFSTPIVDNVTIYAKLSPVLIHDEQPAEKDVTPKTGSNNHLEIALSIVVISLVGIVILKRKDI